MTTELLNEAERFLLNRWLEARALEESMGRVREKYKLLFQRIVKEVETDLKLDANKVYVTQFWDKGSIGFGRKTWPSSDATWIPGLWIDRLRLESLSDQDERAADCMRVDPIQYGEKTQSRFGHGRQTFLKEGRRILGADEIKYVEEPDEDEQVMIRLPMTSKKELLKLLEGDGEQFIECFVSHFRSLARFVPLLDEVFKVG